MPTSVVHGRNPIIRKTGRTGSHCRSKQVCLRSSLSVTRTLGKHHIQLITADETKSALSGCSRYSQQYVTYPSPLTEPEQFSLAVTELCKKENIDIVLPMTELTTTLLLNNCSDLNRTTLPFPDIGTVNTLADKCSLMHLAQTLDIPIPQTWFADNPKSLPVNLEDLTYPIVLKPGKSMLKHDGKWLHTNVRVADNSSKAAEILETDPSFFANPFMLQAYIPGSGAGVFALYDRGKPVAFFAHKRLREKPPRGGLSVLSESVQVDPGLQSYAQKLLEKVGWHGVAMVEFRVDPEGKAYLMEINTRFWGSLQLAVDAGVDFPWLLYQLASSEKVEPVVNYKTGIRLRWLLGDLDSLYLVLRDAEFSLKEKLKAVVAFLTPSPFKTRHEVNRWGDMGPFWWELKQYVKDLLK